MHSDLAKLMETINLLQSEPVGEPDAEIQETKVHPLLQAMQELKEEGILESVEQELDEAKISVKDQIMNDIRQDGGNINDYFVRTSWVDKLGYSTKQIFGRSPDVDDPEFSVDYIGAKKGKPALWFFPASYYLKDTIAYATENPHIWLVKLKPNAWLQPVKNDNVTKQEAPEGKERVGILRLSNTPAAIFFRPGFEVVKKYYDYGSQHKRHGQVKGPPKAEPEKKKSFWQRLFKEEIAYHGTTDDISEFHPFTHFGTEKAAKDRMEYKKIKDGKIYKVDLDIKNPLTIKDFPGIHYDRQYAFELRDKGLISQDEMEAITYIQDKSELRQALLKKLKELDIDGFVYKNKYEDKGNISYVIVDPSQVKVLSVQPANEEVTEASPDTLEGSFTPDLVESKTWLAKMLAKGLKGKNAGTIYILGSWYGNMGIFLQQAGVKFDKLVLVEPDEEALMRSKELLDTLNDDGKLILIHQKAEDIVYEKPGVVINTSCNETGPVFLTKLPDNMLCLLQARNNNEDSLFPTEQMEDFVDYFPLAKVYYTGEKKLEDPEVNYTRFMKIGRTGKKIDETVSTGLGGGSAGSNGGQMVGGPTTYEQEYGMFKSKGPRRITAMTNESEKSFPNIVDTIVKNIPNVNEIYFHGSRAIGKGKRKSDWDILVIVDDSVVGRDYINTVFALQNIAKKFKNFDIQPSHKNNNIARIAKEEGKLLYSVTHKIDEALDSSYPYEGKAISGRYSFETEDGVFYKVYFQGKDLVEIAFSAILPGEEENFRPDKTTITGTGNSRKVFGTVIKIVQDYVDVHEPKALYFIADGSEPSRIKLYSAMAAQVDKALPDYYDAGPTDLGDGKAYMLRRKETKIDEAFDSSYEYRPGKNPGIFYFDTEDGNEYKVKFGTAGKAAEVSFFARGEGDEHKFGLTGTGNAGKIFGTVIQIVKDYVAQNNPMTVLFTAHNSEPSRVRLYKSLASKVDQALPEYEFQGAFNNGNFTQFNIVHKNSNRSATLDKAKAKGKRSFNAVFEDSSTVTLFNLYDGAMPDDDERIWNYVGDSDFDIPFEVRTIQPFVLDQILCDQYGVDDVEDLFHKMQPDQEAVIRDYENDPNLSQQIIVIYGGNQILDGNHRALAAVLANKPIKYIDISDEEEL